MDTANSDSKALTEVKFSFCSKCGESNTATAAFCSSCGQALQAQASLGLTNSIPELESQVASLEQNMERAAENSQTLLQTRFMLAVAYLRKEESSKAIAQLRAVVALDDTNALAHAYLGAALLENYRVEEAQAELEQALELNPNEAIIHLKMGEFNLKLGLVKPALQHLETAFKLPAPSPETAHYIRALLLKVRQMNKKVIERPNRLISFKVPFLAKAWGNKKQAKSAGDNLATPSVVTQAPSQ
jgi:tetratricopeptide (TPR) repeat protein